MQSLSAFKNSADPPAVLVCVDCRRLGLGSMLLASASRVHPAQEGLLAHNLYAHVNWDNSGARSFYQKHGFNRVTVLQEMELIHFQVDCLSGVSEA